jgi:hypothetical protein
MIFAFVYKSPFWAIYPALASEMAVIFVLFGGAGFWSSKPPYYLVVISIGTYRTLGQWTA